MPRDTAFGVFEMGMNHAGEIRYLARLAAPDVALVNNAGPAHIEFFGSVEAVARENGQVITALADDGVAVFPSDDVHTVLWRRLAGKHRQFTFSDVDPEAEVRGAFGAVARRRLGLAPGLTRGRCPQLLALVQLGEAVHTAMIW